MRYNFSPLKKALYLLALLTTLGLLAGCSSTDKTKDTTVAQLEYDKGNQPEETPPSKDAIKNEEEDLYYCLIDLTRNMRLFLDDINTNLEDNGVTYYKQLKTNDKFLQDLASLEAKALAIPEPAHLKTQVAIVKTSYTAMLDIVRTNLVEQKPSSSGGLLSEALTKNASEVDKLLDMFQEYTPS